MSTWSYDPERWLESLRGLPRAERIVGAWLHSFADESGLVTGARTNELRKLAGVTPDAAGRALSALRRQYRLYDIASEAAHYDGVPRTYQLRMNSSPVETRQVLPMIKHRSATPKFRNDPRTGAFVLIEDEPTEGTEDEYEYDRAGSASDDFAAA